MGQVCHFKFIALDKMGISSFCLVPNSQKCAKRGSCKYLILSEIGVLFYFIFFSFLLLLLFLFVFVFFTSSLLYSILIVYIYIYIFHSYILLLLFLAHSSPMLTHFHSFEPTPNPLLSLFIQIIPTQIQPNLQAQCQQLFRPRHCTISMQTNLDPGIQPLNLLELVPTFMPLLEPKPHRLNLAQHQTSPNILFCIHAQYNTEFSCPFHHYDHNT